jgi:hypothetical protein
MRATITKLAVLFVIVWAGLALAQNSPGGAFLPDRDYIVSGQWLWRSNATPICFEGTVEDGFETCITVTNPTADRTFTIPDAAGGTYLVSSLATNGIDVANSIWGASNALVFEGATANAFETSIVPADVGADNTLTLPNTTGALLLSTLTTNNTDVVNSVWAESNGFTFEGATANGFELTVTPGDPIADVTVTLPAMTGTAVVSAVEVVPSGNVTVTANQVGRVFVATAGSGTQTFTLPSAATQGLRYTFVAGDAAGEILVNPQAGQTLSIKASEGGANVTTASGTGIKNTAATNIKNDHITVVSDGTTSWYTMGQSGTWATQ